jgi:hypothetical protein
MASEHGENMEQFRFSINCRNFYRETEECEGCRAEAPAVGGAAALRIAPATKCEAFRRRDRAATDKSNAH